MVKVADVKPIEVCTNPGHNPPIHMVLDPGIYEHKCPGCGKIHKITIIQHHTLR